MKYEKTQSQNEDIIEKINPNRMVEITYAMVVKQFELCFGSLEKAFSVISVITSSNKDNLAKMYYNILIYKKIEKEELVLWCLHNNVPIKNLTQDIIPRRAYYKIMENLVLTKAYKQQNSYLASDRLQFLNQILEPLMFIIKKFQVINSKIGDIKYEVK